MLSQTRPTQQTLDWKAHAILPLCLACVGAGDRLFANTIVSFSSEVYSRVFAGSTGEFVPQACRMTLHIFTTLSARQNENTLNFGSFDECLARSSLRQSAKQRRRRQAAFVCCFKWKVRWPNNSGVRISKRCCGQSWKICRPLLKTNANFECFSLRSRPY